MPYIEQEDRGVLDSGIAIPSTPGELNYVLTRVAVEYLAAGKINYTRMAEVISAFECAKLEFARRVMAPYEDAKCQENGDVYQSVLP